MGDPEPLLPEDAATVVSIGAWYGRTSELAVLLAASGHQTEGPRVIPNPPGSPPDPPQFAGVADPTYWATDLAARRTPLARQQVPAAPSRRPSEFWRSGDKR